MGEGEVSLPYHFFLFLNLSLSLPSFQIWRLLHYKMEMFYKVPIYSLDQGRASLSNSFMVPSGLMLPQLPSWLSLLVNFILCFQEFYNQHLKLDLFKLRSTQSVKVTFYSFLSHNPTFHKRSL